MASNMKKTQEFMLKNVSCMSCVRRIESKLSALAGIDEAKVNFSDKTLIVSGKIAAKEVIMHLDQIGYAAEKIKDNIKEITIEKPRVFLKIILPGVLGLLLMLYGMSDYSSAIVPHRVSFFWIIMALVTLIIMLIAGLYVYTSAYKALIKRHTTMNTLIALGTIAAWGYSLMVIIMPAIVPDNARHIYLEAALIIIALVNLGAFLESKAKGRASEAISNLMDLQPQYAYRINAEGQEEKVSINELKLHDDIRVKPGAKIALDGVIIDGHSYIDESMLTGEPCPVTKTPGCVVFSGTMNKTGSFSYRVTKLEKDTILTQIIALVKQAQNTKPAIAKLADIICGYFVPFVISCAISTALIWYYLGFGMGFMLVTGIAVLIIACPCALGLATPMSVIVGIGKAAQQGILIKNGEVLQKASKVTHIVLDKTGTITKGEPQVVAIECIDKIQVNDLLTIAASLESYSEHPLAVAIVSKAQKLKLKLVEISDFHTHTGLGITGMVEGKNVIIGNRALIEKHTLSQTDLEEFAITKSREGQTVLYVAIDHTLVGIIAIADPIKDDAKTTIDKLIAHNIEVTMVTGDHPITANAVAKSLGIGQVLAQSMPKDKREYVRLLQQKNEIVAMVGDGINDAPALTQADVGFAIGSGTDIAIESADVTLMRSSLTGVLDGIFISKAVMRNIRQNLFGAFIYNAISIPIAAGIFFPIFGVLLNPMIAAAAMALSSLTVVMNANRLRFLKTS